MQKPTFLSWEFLQDKVDNPYEAVLVISREARRLNSIPSELQQNRREKITTQASLRLIDNKIKFQYVTPPKHKRNVF